MSNGLLLESRGSGNLPAILSPSAVRTFLAYAPKGKEKCGRLDLNFGAKFYLFIYKKELNVETQILPRSVQFLLEKKESLKKKGIVTFSFRSFESFLNAWKERVRNFTDSDSRIFYASQLMTRTRIPRVI